MTDLLRNKGKKAMTAYAGIPTKTICTKEFYKLNKDRWYYEVNFLWFFWKKVYYGDWREMYCLKHKRHHNK